MSDYTVEQFAAEARAILQADGQAGLPRIAEALRLLLANEAFVTATWDDETPPGKRVLHHDPDTDMYVLAHVQPAGKKPGSPHTHGSSWAVYGNARGSTEMTLYRRVNPESDEHAELEVIDAYTLAPGYARPYPSGAIHRTEQREKAWVIRVTGTDLDALPRYRFDAQRDKVLA